MKKMLFNKNKLAKNKFIVLILILVFLNTAIVNKTSAMVGFWGDGTTGAIVAHNLRITHERIYGFMLSTLKQIAAKAILENVSSEISGNSSSSALFIVDWKDELFLKPARETTLIMNDFFTNSVRGRGSIVDYKTLRTNPYLPEEAENNVTEEILGVHGERLGGNYIQQLINGARSYLFDPIQTKPDIQEYINGDINNMFANGSWRPYFAFINNDANNPFGYYLNTQRIAMNITNQLEKEATIKAIAYQGYKSKNKNGFVVTPGINIKDLQSKAQGMSFDMLSNATYLQEVVVGLVTRISSSIIRDGIGHIQENIQKENGKSYGNYINNIHDNVRENNYNPNDLFKPIY